MIVMRANILKCTTATYASLQQRLCDKETGNIITEERHKTTTTESAYVWGPRYR